MDSEHALGGVILGRQLFENTTLAEVLNCVRGPVGMCVGSSSRQAGLSVHVQLLAGDMTEPDGPFYLGVAYSEKLRTSFGVSEEPTAEERRVVRSTNMHRPEPISIKGWHEFPCC